MKWKRIYKEDNERMKIPVSVSSREIKLIQNYLNKGKPLNDPDNKECLDTVLRILSDIVKNSGIENLDIDVSNWLADAFGVEMTNDPYGKNSGIELADNGLIEMKECINPDFDEHGKYSEFIQGGFWDDDGHLQNGFISIEDLNAILDTEPPMDEMEVKSIQLRKEGNMAKLLLDI